MSDRYNWRYLAVGAIVWFLHLNIVYPATSLACNWGWLPFTIAGIPALRVFQIVASIVAGLLLAFILVLTRRSWLEIQAGEANTVETVSLNRHLFAAYVTTLVNCFFLLFVLASFVPILTLSPCR